jgi:hypothetical protein
MVRHSFEAMGCEIVVAGGTARARRKVERLFHSRDRSSERLEPEPRPVGTPPPADPRPLRLAGRFLERPPDLVMAATVDDALALLDGPAWLSAGGVLLACRGGVDVALPDGELVRLRGGGLATVRHPSESPWLDVTVCASSCLQAAVAAGTASLLGHDGPEWLHERRLAGRFRDADGVIVETAAWHRSHAAAAA